MATASYPTPLPSYHSGYPSPAVDSAGGLAANIISNSPMSRRSFSPRGGASSSDAAASTIVIAPAAVTPPSRPVSYTDVPGKTTEPSDKAAAVVDAQTENAGEKPEWNKPSNGVAVVSPVMGVLSESISESTVASPKSSSFESLKKQSDAQGTGNVFSTSHSGGSTGYSSSRESTHSQGGQRGGFWSQSHGGNEYQQQQSSLRRGNGGPNPRGDGYHHHNYGGRHDQHCGNQDWNTHRSFGGRNAHTQHQRGGFSRPFIRGPHPATTPYIHPPFVSARPPYAMPVVHPVYYPHGSYPDQFRAMPMVCPIGPLFVPPGDPHLLMKILNQIDYYFSNENLVKDTYLRQNMDEQGWVSIRLIAGFKKVTQLTNDIQLVLTALQSSTVVEIEDEKVRRRDDWRKWIISCHLQYP